MFVLLDIFDVGGFEHNIDPQLTVGEVHQHEQANPWDAVFVVVRYGKHDFEQKEKECHDPYGLIRTGKRYADKAQPAKNEEEIGNEYRGEEYIIECKSVKKVESQPLVFEVGYVPQEFGDDVVIAAHPPHPLFDPHFPLLRFLLICDRVRDVFDLIAGFVNANGKFRVFRQRFFVPAVQLMDERCPHDEICSGEGRNILHLPSARLEH